MESNLKTALTRKRVLKTNITKFKEKVNLNLKDADSVQFELFKTKTKAFLVELNEVFNLIYENCTEDLIEQYIDEFNSIQDNLDEINLLVNRESCNNQTASASNATIRVENSEVKLPKLSLPVFNGKIEEWLGFQDLFIATIHNNLNLSNAQKLQYLKGTCKADALKIIQTIPISDANYAIAWDLLVERFSNKREIINAVISKLLNQPNIQDNSASMLQLVDITTECIRSLSIMDQTIKDFSDVLINHLLVEKLDKNTRAWWERSLKKDELGTVDKLLSFLKDHARTLQNTKIPQKEYKRSQQKYTSLISEVKNCLCCKGEHILLKCSKFINFPINRRVSFVKEKNLCFNCLSNMHRIRDCKSENKCRVCNKMHHSLLHFEKAVNKSENAIRSNGEIKTQVLSAQAESFRPRSFIESENDHSFDLQSESVNLCAENHDSNEIASNGNDSKGKQVLLCTVKIKVRNSRGKLIDCRAVLDSASQGNFLTEECFRKLGLERRNARFRISCLGTTNAHTNGETQITFTPHFSSETFSASVFVIDKITGNLPYFTISSNISNNYKDLVLADPTFYKSGSIDILLGIDVFLFMMKGEAINRGEGLPRAVCSKLGWIIAGTVAQKLEEPSPISVSNIQLTTDELVKRFWELDTVPEVKVLSKIDQDCEDHFLSTHFRDSSGRYVVKLPFKESPSQLGDSREQAVRRFKNLELRLVRNPNLYDSYKSFMKEYERKGHMGLVSQTEAKPLISYYLPHHAVIKESSTTTKLRVVFDASAKSSTGVSLNDILMVGPRIQPELFPILLRFRTFPVVITADIEKMFRQVKVNSEDRDFQRILWRERVDLPIEEYRLKTVTYGTASAPFLSTRVLHQLAMDEEENFPLASMATLNGFFVDDLLTGAINLEEASELVTQLMLMMQKGGFVLRKWSSNHNSVLGIISEEFKDKTELMTINSEEGIKILGILWNPKQDCFNFSVSPMEEKEEYSKRDILSEVARMFDPLGWLSPCVIWMKILIQQLWIQKSTWDEPICEELSKKWKLFRKELYIIEQVQFSRFVLIPSAVNIQVHAFCDASEKAYCTAIYLRSVSSDSTINVSLLTSKTRVAPLKTQSLPRLELCAAVLLANCMKVILQNLSMPIQDTVAWTDSTVALAWITSEPYRWQSFVANRVSRIQTVLPNVKWAHVQGDQNPADCGTRGLYPSEFVSCDIWKNGPEFLRQPLEPINAYQVSDRDISEQIIKEEKRSLTTTVAQLQGDHFIFKYSSWSKLYRVTAWCLRFLHNIKHPSSNRIKGFLSSNELNNAVTAIVKIVQEHQFTEELTFLRSNKALRSSSKIISLNPFIDESGVMRVGGRLRHANISENQKHPILLPKRHHVTELIVSHFHLTHLHAGPQLLLAVIRQQFWILCGRDVVRRIVKCCITCFRNSASPNRQIMADLPSSRVRPSRPFSRTGIDYAGPFMYKTRQGRNFKSFKCYIAIFVCFTTRAIHLELVTNLSTQTFLAALRRFISRRGKPTEIISDCGTNFKGASKELKELYKAVQTFETSEEMSHLTSSEGIMWKFNPPAAPHFGGLWEAGVKSMKYHLKRIVGDSLLTFEEFSTLLAQVEACLNSRPLCPMSSDPNDFEVLTPGHFLIGAPLTAIPEPDLCDEPIGGLRRWQLIQRTFQHFWKRWTSEYLAKLQQRPKWFLPKRNLAIGDLVLIKNELLPTHQWKLGRVKEIHPGTDGKVRVATVRTLKSEFKRPVQKLCLLPLDSN